jgi:hypothetical protein
MKMKNNNNMSANENNKMTILMKMAWKKKKIMNEKSEK